LATWSGSVEATTLGRCSCPNQNLGALKPTARTFMSFDNVIIFGAGASFDAKIPLLSNFVETMWTYATRGTSPNGPIKEEDKALFDEAIEIRKKLERYNSRANFNIRNLEDILSLLSFESLAGGEALNNYETWVKAITKTIELSTNIPFHDSKPYSPKYTQTIYHQFWNVLLGPASIKRHPALITFNYDLVFERSLWEFYHIFNDQPEQFFPVKEIDINYFLNPESVSISKELTQYNEPISIGTGAMVQGQKAGFKPRLQFGPAKPHGIPYLKLHGSLNWGEPVPADDETNPRRFIQAAEKPLILPPVFNKMNSVQLMPVWGKALEILRNAKHIIIVGYSLPKTDIYMQYFLKSAVGPNSDLQKIVVFDPVLFTQDSGNAEMRKRYEECFSPQFQPQIIFNPSGLSPDRRNYLGTFEHFVHSLRRVPNELLFI